MSNTSIHCVRPEPRASSPELPWGRRGLRSRRGMFTLENLVMFLLVVAALIVMFQYILGAMTGQAKSGVDRLTGGVLYDQ